MALWPDQVFLFVPGFGLLICCTSMLFLIAMRKSLGGGGFYAAMYTLRAMDLLLGLSLFYAAFHGILLSVYGNQNEDMPPLRCLFTALHLHIWVFTDSAQMLLLALLCADQFISVAWTKRHNQFSEYYFNFFPLLFVLFLSAGTLVPACLEPFLLAENDTVRVSSFCAMSDAFGHEFYDAHLTIRKWFPFGGVAILSLTGLVLCLLQLKQQGRFKWSDNNGQSARFFLLGLCRALLLAASVHLPLLQLYFGRTKFNREEKHFLQEISIRIWQAFLFGLLELILELLLLPHFPAKIAEFFNLTEVKRTWQSADDPPAPNRSVGTSGWDIFGSFHSTTGNIIGDAGVPLELNADVQRSVSFYYKDGDD